jgi:hypothetical protein
MRSASAAITIELAPPEQALESVRVQPKAPSVSRRRSAVEESG